jgi:hypothetical protein
MAISVTSAPDVVETRRRAATNQCTLPISEESGNPLSGLTLIRPNALLLLDALRPSFHLASQEGSR